MDIQKFLLIIIVCWISIIPLVFTKAESHRPDEIAGNRIVGGQTATEHQFPYQISLRLRGLHNCGGSIISKWYVLTAAHCVGNYNWDAVFEAYNTTMLTVRVGSNDRFADGLVYKVTEIVIHEKYGNFLNDIALLRLEKPLIFSVSIQPIALMTEEVPVNSKLLVSGWGRLDNFGDVPRYLQWVTLTGISQEQCANEIGYNEESLLCLKHPEGEGACFGDSGGPAVLQGKLAGVLSFVSNNCGSKYPDSFGKVSYHYDWIRKHSDISEK